MKKFKLVDGKAVSTVLDESAVGCLDWNLCVLCQNVTNEPLQCPKDTKRSDVRAGYKSLATSLA